MKPDRTTSAHFRKVSGALFAVAMAACGLTVAGSSSSPPDASAPDDAGADIAVEEHDAGRDSAGDAADGNESDAGVEEAGFECPDASATFASGTLRVPPIATAVTVDGDLSDWKCARFFSFDRTTAGATLLDPNVPNAYSFAVAWDSSYVYVAVRATDPPPLEGNVTPEIYKNDAIEVYLGGDTMFDGSYSSIDHQWVVDWANRTRHYQRGAGSAVSAGFTSMVKTTATGYEVELRVAASEVGRASLTPSTKLGFAFAGADSNGTLQTTWMLWFRPNVACDAGCCQIPCDTRFFGDLLLVP
jgi:hypothetical protein